MPGAAPGGAAGSAADLAALTAARRTGGAVAEAAVATVRSNARAAADEIREAAAQAGGAMGPEGPVAADAIAADETACDPGDGPDTWLDRTQRGVFRTVCGTARWFDGFFGDRQRFDATTETTNGRLGLGAFWDQRDGFDPDFRLRARVDLPALENRANLLLGRGNDEELIEDRGPQSSDTLPSRFEAVDDPGWLLGLGYRKGQSLKRGFDTSVGLRLRAPPEPYANARWFRNWTLSDATLLRLRETVFWTTDRQLGTTTQFDYDQLLSDSMMLRLGAWGTLAQRNTQGLAWGTNVILYKGLSDRRALTGRLFLFGETGAAEPLQNYGFEARFRRRVLRKWLFIESRASVSWPQFDGDAQRELNLGVGVALEMYFGSVPDEQMR